MNDSADKLKQQLFGAGSPKQEPVSADIDPKRATTAAFSPDETDHWRILLVDLVYLLNASFKDAHYWEGVKKEKDTFKKFVKILHELSQMPDNDGQVRIKFRGSPGTKVPGKNDYIIRFGDFTVDITAISAVIKRMGIRVKHLEGRLIKAFEMFSDQGIDSIFVKIPNSSDESLERMKVSLRIISYFRKAVEDDTPIEYYAAGKQRGLKPILNEAGLPDPNLTQLAAINDMSPDNIKDMVKKVAALRKRPDFVQSGNQWANVYQTIFNIKSLRQRLIRPPIELNSDTAPEAERSQNGDPGAVGIQGVGVDHLRGSGPAGFPGTGSFGIRETGTFNVQEKGGTADQGTGPGGGSGILLRETDPAALKTNVAAFVKQNYSDSPGITRQVMNTVYGDDYHQLDLSGLESRLQLVTNLLTALEKSEKGRYLLEGVLQRIQAGIDELPKDVLDDLIVEDDVIKIWEDEEEKVIGKADNELLNIIDATKNRSATRKKMKAALRPDVHFSDQDYDQMAKTFDISVQDAEEIVTLLKSCFDGQGNFQKPVFDKNLPGFVRHQKRIFEILWEFLKEIQRRSDRIPFLNSLQLLVKQINQPKQAIKVLVSDFMCNPAEISFLDRNAMMLAIQLLRTYNKEIRTDIEITPEEVLLVKEGLDHRVVRYMAWKIDGEQKRFVEKILTIRQKIIESIEKEGSDAKGLPIRFLLALEREVYIFLALVGGKTAAAVIRSALTVYGDPISQIYLLEKSRQHTASLLQHLAVLIRSLGRVGRKKDFALLNDIKNREQGFMSLADGPRHLAQVQRTLGGIDSAKNEIRKRENQTGGET